MTVLDESPLLSPAPDSISPSPEPLALNLPTSIRPDAEAAQPLTKLKAKQEWVRSLRLKFCIRPEFEITKNMIHEDGTLNQDYFRPPKGAKPEETRKWTDREKELLLQGIGKLGIGHFREISEEFLPAWSGNDLRLKTIRLIGRQNLQLYRSWRGTPADVAREYERNKRIGTKFGTWKQGVLVYDDDGKVEAEIMKTEVGSEADAVEADEADEDVEMEIDEVEEEGRVTAVSRVDKNGKKRR